MAHELANVQRRRVLLLSQRSTKVSRRWRLAVPSVIQVTGLGDVKEVPVAMQRRPYATNDGEGKNRQKDYSPGPAQGAPYCAVQVRENNRLPFKRQPRTPGSYQGRDVIAVAKTMPTRSESSAGEAVR